MAHSAEIDRIRWALEALASGDLQLVEFEELVIDAIDEGSLTRADVRLELKAVIDNGTLQADSLRRMGFEERAAPSTVYRPTGPLHSNPPRSGQETVLRPATGLPSQELEPALAIDTESNWVDPDEAAAGGDVAIGQLLGRRYRLERILGSGGMGVVYFATDQELKGETFAIKVLKPEIREHPESLPLLREEVRKARSLHHPNIAGVYSMNSDRAGIYMLMEYLEGKTVAALLDEEFGRGMPLMRAWPLIKDIAAALAYAHDHSVIHSDLKPSNIFVTTSAKAKLLDFGVARAARVRTGHVEPNTLGALTPSYASYEMLEGRAPDQSDDVYAFACVIYEMLSGKHPFNHCSAVEARAAGLRPLPLASLTRGQNEALAHALAFERAQRTASVEALLAELEGAPPHRLPPRLLWIGAGAAAVAVTGVAVWIIVSMFVSANHQPKTAKSHPVPSAPAPAPVSGSGAASVPATVGAPEPAPVAPTHSEKPALATGPAPATGSVVPATGPTPATGPAPATGSAPATGPAPAKAPALALSPKPMPTSPAVAEPPKTADEPSSEGQEHPSSAMSQPPLALAPLPAAVPATKPEQTPRADDVIKPPPPGKNAPWLKLAPEYASFADSCPYPPEALARGDTGQVILMVYVAPDGSVLDTRVDTSSNSEVLDQAAANCVKDNGHFVARTVGTRKVAYWGRTRFNWSFGG